MKVILNKCFGGFGISPEGYKLYCQKKNIPCYFYRTVYLKNDHIGYNKVKNPDWADYCFTEDFGDLFEGENNEFEKMLYLDSEYREDATLIEVVEELGEKANGRFAELVVVDIPDGLNYVIDEYDGIETLHERVKEW